MTEAEQQGLGGAQYDSPNQEVVGVGPPWVEGDGGAAGTQADDAGNGGEKSLDDMTKDELIEVASERGLDVNAQMNKAEIRKVIDDG